jgi:hypothetical protein
MDLSYFGGTVGQGSWIFSANFAQAQRSAFSISISWPSFSCEVYTYGLKRVIAPKIAEY